MPIVQIRFSTCPTIVVIAVAAMAERHEVENMVSLRAYPSIDVVDIYSLTPAKLANNFMRHQIKKI